MEIEEYTQWFMAPHSGAEDDLIALDGLREETDGPSSGP